MCTLILALHPDTPRPLLVAHNRDERRDRPAQEPSWWEDAPDIFAPRDLVAMGTWFGVNARKLVVGITNRFGHAPDPAKRSRGELVHLALTHPDAPSAAASIAALEPSHYNPFHLILADQSAAYVVWHHGSHLEKRALEPGHHVFTERSFGAAPSQRESFLHQELSTLDQLTPTQTRRLLAHQAGMGFDDVRVDLPEMNYGTRASTLVTLDASKMRFVWAQGGFTPQNPGALVLEM